MSRQARAGTPRADKSGAAKSPSVCHLRVEDKKTIPFFSRFYTKNNKEHQKKLTAAFKIQNQNSKICTRWKFEIQICTRLKLKTFLRALHQQSGNTCITNVSSFFFVFPRFRKRENSSMLNQRGAYNGTR